MKTILLAIAISVAGSQVLAQHHNISKKFKISFTTSELLENYETESEDVLEYDNDNYAVDVEVLPLKGTADEYIHDLYNYAVELAFGFEEVTDGGSVPNIKDSYYV